MSFQNLLHRLHQTFESSSFLRSLGMVAHSFAAAVENSGMDLVLINSSFMQVKVVQNT